MRLLLLTIGAAATCFGCASIQNSEAIKTERVLAAAGFQMRLADTPQKLAKVEAMTQRKLVPHQKDGETMFVYADATACKCVYAGTQQANQRYQQLAIQQKLANQAENTAALNQDSAMDWDGMGGMGGWGPWY
jgi:hypothetical protein